MTTKAALFTLLALWGVGPCLDMSAMAEEETSEVAADNSPVKRSFTNRVWVKEESGDLPGVMRIFLSDGTLVQDSCWETHRLSAWSMTSDTELIWNEDGTDISATIASLTGGALELDLKLGAETVRERYVSAEVPYVCPDMPR